MSRENRSRFKKRYISRDRKFRKRKEIKRCNCIVCRRNRLYSNRKRRAEMIQKIRDWSEENV